MEIGEGIVRKPSSRSVAETLDRLETILKARGIQVFARIDHAGEAARVGLSMPPTQVLIFGNPRAGTPVMLAAPTAAIDLPLKVLAWQDAVGKVWLGYTDPATSLIGTGSRRSRSLRSASSRTWSTPQ